jgi:hypothetical protein
MPLTKSAARTRVRTRIRDTVATYEYSDTIVDGYLPSALQEIASALRSAESDYYLRSGVVLGYTDALDPKPSGQQGYEMYPLPPGCAAVRWIERISNGIVQYRLRQVSARDQEGHRHWPGGFFRYSQITVANGGDTATVSPIAGRETFSIHGNRFRIVPPPTAAGTHEFRVWHEKDPDEPKGEEEDIDIPTLFEESLVLVWGRKVVKQDYPETANSLADELKTELSKALADFGKRTRRDIQLGSAF